MKVYFAGPDIFRTDAEEHFNRVKELCKKLKFKPLIPMFKSESPEELHYNCLGMINECDAVVANITPFRGPSCDVGTAFELGYATAMARIKPIEIVTYSNELIVPYKTRVKFFNKLNTADSDGMDIEDFGLSDNLMITVPLKNGPFKSVDEALKKLKKRLTD